MKKGLLLLLLISCSLFAKAQQDSILVVIECDSLYRPFKKELGSLSVDFNTNDYNVSRDFELKMGDKNSFKIPIPANELELYELDIQFYKTPVNQYFSGESVRLGNEGWIKTSYNNLGVLVDSQLIKYGDDLTLRFSFPLKCEYNKYLINNTCTVCALQDSVSWIVYGGAIEDPITRKIWSPEVYNPYNNPISSMFFSGDCDVGGCQPHWYCNRCKREY